MLGPLLISPQPTARIEPLQVKRAAATHDYVTIPFNDSSGKQLHLRDSRHGVEGPQQNSPFLLLHGFTFNLSTWDAMFSFFASVDRTVAYDQLPYGLSEKPLAQAFDDNNPYRREAAAGRAIGLLDQLQLSGAILVGNSSGATLALDVASRAPDQLSGLVLISPWVYSSRPTLPGWLVNTPQMQRVSIGLARYLGKEMPLLDRSYADPTLITARQRELANSHRWIAGWDLAWGALLQRSLIEEVTVSDSLKKIELPTLIIAGAGDKIVKPQDSARVAGTMSNAVFVLIPDCGHMPQQECPEQVEAAITDWLRTNR